ncbi:hypothetical protein PILCRDRAFT_820543 [Piloderma croceum F 1598]|uniref:Uncharacterized protein n=1 Tax=Piloderma croceum (strain F 1598) TaxID=765440 RepID=A0A0C3FR68_PILCF|nr:hypothetical protein PILCRDRAFT_820543 [Piloderma croceum F 1598]
MFLLHSGRLSPHAVDNGDVMQHSKSMIAVLRGRKAVSASENHSASRRRQTKATESRDKGAGA